MSIDQKKDTAPVTYKDSGVDIEAGDALVERIRPMAKRTLRPEVLEGIGGFGALVEISKKYKNPVLVSGTDGVGTKLRVAFELDWHHTVGIDLVAMSVNDILVQGAEPLFFLDYFATGHLDVARAAQVIEGVANGCELAGCALIGGETAEMPDSYPPGEYDLAGFAVGVVEKENLITGQLIQAGDVVLGIASSGPHSNGYSLIRRILKQSGISLGQIFAEEESDQTWGSVLMEPTRIYVKPLLEIFSQSKILGLAHITGGGLSENIPRILPAHLGVQLSPAAWRMPDVFQKLQKLGAVADEEMWRVFNCGIGMVMILTREQVSLVQKVLSTTGWDFWEIGRVVERSETEACVRMI
jgi:phosphoribosylformylglycinamidine cyclo-ligase